MMKNEINIGAYSDYRRFLRDTYTKLKKENPVFSFRYFAKKGGFSSASFLKLVIDRKRNLTLESIQKCAKALKLTKEETEFFEALVLFNQAKSIEEKNEYLALMLRNRRYQAFKALTKDQFHYFSKWYYTAIRELVSSHSFRNDPVWISRMLIPSITEKEAKEALDVLLKLGLLKKEKDGRLIQADAVVESAPEVTSLFLVNFHKEMIQKASESIERIPHDERDITSATVTIRNEDLGKLKERITKFRKELLSLCEAHTHEGDRVVQINIQLFPLTKKGTKS